MSCIDASCYRKKYPAVFLLLKNGIPTQKLRERHQHFLSAYPKDPIILIDEKIEQIMDYFDNYMPKVQNYHLIKELQSKLPEVEPKQDELKKYSHILKNLVSKHYENILNNSVAV